MSNLVVVPANKQQQFLQAKADASVLCKNLTELKVVDDETQKHAEKALVAIKAQADEIESLRTSISKPINDWLKDWKARADDAKSPLELADKHLRNELRSRQAALATKRAEEARKIEAERQVALKAAEEERKATEAKKAEAEAAMAVFGCDDPGGEAERAAALKQAEHDQKMADIEKQARVRTREAQEANSVAGARTVWTFEVVDFDLVPRTFMEINEKLVRDQIRAGVRDIPGFRIFQDTRISVR